MTCKGKVQNGVVVLDDPKALPEGSLVIVESVSDSEAAADTVELNKLRRTFLRFAGVAQGLPSDMARNHDHYLHGKPKK